jgi:hypothetical protein
MIKHVIEITKTEHAFLAVVHSAYGVIKVVRNVRTDAIEIGSIE